MSLWLCIQLPQLPLEALAAAGPATVVYAQQGSRRWVVATALPQAAAGEALASVQMRFPEVQPRARDLPAEKAALQALGCLAWQLGDHVLLIDEAPRAPFDTPFQAVTVDIEPSLQVFRGLAPLLAEARRLLGGTPYQARFGIAPTLEAAAVAARLQLPALTDRHTLRQQLAALPLQALRLPPPALEVLYASGHETLADVLRHDSASLAARLGPEFPRRLERLLGPAPDLRPRFTPAPRYRRKFDLDGEIDDWQALLFPLKRLFEEFEAYLRARQVAVAQVSVTLARRGARQEDFLLRTTAPGQDAAVFLRLIHERWNARPPQQAAGEIRLQADYFLPLRPPQTQLFQDESSSGDEWDAVVDRLHARLGEASIWRPGLASDHRPEHAWSAGGGPQAEAFEVSSLPPRPLWLLRQPQPAPADIALQTPAERFVAGWWASPPVHRDYHFASGPNHEALWVCFDHLSGRYLTHGLVR